MDKETVLEGYAVPINFQSGQHVDKAFLNLNDTSSHLNLTYAYGSDCQIGSVAIGKVVSTLIPWLVFADQIDVLVTFGHSNRIFESLISATGAEVAKIEVEQQAFLRLPEPFESNYLTLALVTTEIKPDKHFCSLVIWLHSYAS